MCPVCEGEVWRPNAWLKKLKLPTCSKSCNGVLRGKEWAKHGYKGRAGWTEASRKSYLANMSGPNNPAWKGGVTYFKKKGNYKNVKYVRCPTEYLGMARKDGYIMEHRLIVARALGRLLSKTEAVHHEDHDTANNSLKNLMLFASNRDHKLYEHHGLPEPIWRGSSQPTT